MTIRLKRVHDDPAENDGHRVLVDRLWPRGFSKERAELDEWAKDAAPSTGLREWFHAREEVWGEFRKRYLRELSGNREATEPLVERLESGGVVTLLYASRDRDRNHAWVLAEYLAKRSGAEVERPG